jgi:hypothetical protein
MVSTIMNNKLLNNSHATHLPYTKIHSTTEAPFAQVLHYMTSPVHNITQYIAIIILITINNEAIHIINLFIPHKF